LYATLGIMGFVLLSGIGRQRIKKK
jgi:hypothetical protein